MRVIKRDGSEVEFAPYRIEDAIHKANESALRQELTRDQIFDIAMAVSKQCEDLHRSVHVEEIQDMVMEGPLGDNSFYLSLLYADKQITDIPFIASMNRA